MGPAGDLRRDRCKAPAGLWQNRARSLSDKIDGSPTGWGASLNSLAWFIFVTVCGACVGSFVNVVVLRLPEGKSLTRPRSHCPACSHAIAWYDNVPVLSWLLLRGRCHHCGAWISIQYPLVETVAAILFGGLFAVYYLTDLRPGFSTAGLALTWPVLIVHLTLVSALLAASIIDARLFIIPLMIPWFATAAAVAVLPAAVQLGLPPYALPIPAQARDDLVVPMACDWQVHAALGGLVGLAAAVALLRLGFLPQSFNQTEELVADPMPPDEFLDYPHPRREVCKELLFVAPPLVTAVLAAMFIPIPAAGYPPFWHALAGVALGYLVGGGVVWLTRILGTLGFGKEAMGLGDVHLLAAIGAVVGWKDTVFVFFVAPFFGLIAAVIMAGLKKLLKGKVRIIPYGPYLAAAAVLVMVLRQPLLAFLLCCSRSTSN